MKAWTFEQTALFKELYPTTDNKELSELFNCTVVVLKRKALKWGLRKEIMQGIKDHPFIIWQGMIESKGKLFLSQRTLEQIEKGDSSVTPAIRPCGPEFERFVKLNNLERLPAGDGLVKFCVAA